MARTPGLNPSDSRIPTGFLSSRHSGVRAVLHRMFPHGKHSVISAVGRWSRATPAPIPVTAPDLLRPGRVSSPSRPGHLLDCE